MAMTLTGCEEEWGRRRDTSSMATIWIVSAGGNLLDGHDLSGKGGAGGHLLDGHDLLVHLHRHAALRGRPAGPRRRAHLSGE
jgi:hypothetical protein